MAHRDGRHCRMKPAMLRICILAACSSTANGFGLATSAHSHRTLARASRLSLRSPAPPCPRIPQCSNAYGADQQCITGSRIERQAPSRARAAQEKRWRMQAMPGSGDVQLLLATAVSGSDAWRYFFAGGMCCCISHGVTVPIDVVKTRMQTDPEIKALSVTDAATYILEREGAKGLFAGFGSTLIGFTTSGAVKYGLYEVFKPFSADFIASISFLPNSPILGFLLAGACAELVASVLLCPLEATRIRLVTDPTYGNEVFDALPRMWREEGWEIYQGLPAIMTKMVPGTMSQLASYEFFTRSAYATATALGVQADTSNRFVISTGCAVLAGVISTLTSQPGDTVLSEMNKAGGQGQTIMSVVKGLDSPQELFRGVKARLIHLLALITSQLVIYDYAKQLVGLAATGAAK